MLVFTRLILILLSSGLATGCTLIVGEREESTQVDGMAFDGMGKGDGGVRPGLWLRRGGLSPLGPRPPKSGRYRIVSDDIRAGGRSCAGARCVTGGIAP